MDLNDVVQYLLNAVSLGSLYALMALGLAVVYSILRLVNLAYGELIMVTGYTIFVLQDSPLPWLALALIAIVAAMLASVITERVAFRPVRANSLNAMLVTSFAVSTLFQNGALLLVSPRTRAIETPTIFTTNLLIGDLRIPVANVLTIVVSVLLLLMLTLLLRRTTLGIALRAAADDFPMTRMLGIRADRIIATAFAISGLLAGVVGIFWLSRLSSVVPTVGLQPLLIALIATVIGGMSGLAGAIVGGYLLGFVTVGMSTVLPPGLLDYRDAFTFLLVIVVLLFRPEGLIRGRYQTRRVG
jgi:branched-chain amino acid transport system permease protein